MDEDLERAREDLRLYARREAERKIGRWVLDVAEEDGTLTADELARFAAAFPYTSAGESAQAVAEAIRETR
jgi:hypothetical protein